MKTLPGLHREIAACERCPRLRRHCQAVARAKKRAYLDQEYWGKPVPGFGDPRAELVVVGLAPGAHGANRTGRVFTGDRSGEWLYRALHRAGFANQALSSDRRDGLVLTNAYVTCVAKCAPPGNKPLPTEIKRCSDYLERELGLLSRARVFVTLGQIAVDGIWPHLAPGAQKPRPRHGDVLELPGGRWLVHSYHPSQQNTFTGKLTEPMFDRVFREARHRLGP